MQKKILILLLALCFPISVFAETIELKSGKTVEGKIIEKTDKYIKVDFMGVPITYYFNEIDTINGERATLPIPNQEANKPAVALTQNSNLNAGVQLNDATGGFMEASQQGNAIEFENWIKSKEISNYFNSERILAGKNDRASSEIKRSYNEAKMKGDLTRAREIETKNVNEVSTFINNLKSLHPPVELESYHKKNIESFDYLRMGLNELANNDRSSCCKRNAV